MFHHLNILSSPTVTPPCYDGQISLIDESVSNAFTNDSNSYPYTLSGIVSVCLNGTFGAVCANGWDDRDAVVVCLTLGFYDSDCKFLILIIVL